MDLRRRSMAVAIAFGLAGLHFPPGSPGQAAAWQPFEYAPGRYKVSLPSKPVMKQGQLRTEIGVVMSVRHTADGADATYDVTYNDYPRDAIARLGSARLIETARDGLVYQSKGKLVSDKPFTLGKLTGREHDIAGEDGTLYRIRLLLVDNRLYQLTAMALPPARADDRKFFESFQLTRESP